MNASPCLYPSICFVCIGNDETFLQRGIHSRTYKALIFMYLHYRSLLNHQYNRATLHKPDLYWSWLLGLYKFTPKSVLGG